MLFQVQRIEPTDKVAQDIAGKMVTIELPDPVLSFSIWSRIIEWLQANPEIIMIILSALAALFSIVPEVAKRLEKGAPPTK